MVMAKKLKYDLKKDKPISYWAGVGLFAGSTILFTVILILSLNSGQERTFYSVGVFAFMAVFSFIWLILLLTRAYERFYGDHKKWFDSWGVAIPNVLIAILMVAGSVYFMVTEGFSMTGVLLGLMGLFWGGMSIFAAKKRNED
jgi:hypothetical protein